MESCNELSMGYTSFMQLTKILNDPSQIAFQAYSTRNKTEMQSRQCRLDLFEGKTSYAAIRILKKVPTNIKLEEN